MTGVQTCALPILRRALGDLDKVGDTLGNLGLVLTDQVNPDAQVLFEEAQKIWERLGNSSNVARIKANLGLLCWKLGELTEAEANFEEALQAVQHIGEDVIAHAVYNNLGAVRFEQKKFYEAREAYQKALKSPRVSRSGSLLARFHCNLAEVNTYMGNFEAAKDHLSNFFTLMNEYPNNFLLGFVFNIAGIVNIIEGDLTNAGVKFREAIKYARIGNFSDIEANALMRLARIERNVEMAQKARQLHETLLTRVSQDIINGNYEKALSELEKESNKLELACISSEQAILTNDLVWIARAEQYKNNLG